MTEQLKAQIREDGGTADHIATLSTRRAGLNKVIITFVGDGKSFKRKL